MARYTVVTMPGDGIGKVVLPESVRVLDAVGFDAEYVHGDIGWDFWMSEGNALPERTVELLAKHKLGLFGAITSKPKGEADRELRPELRGKGHTYFSPIVGMRQRFNLDICLRPCRSFPGNPLNFIRRTMDGGFEEPVVDTVIFRQNTEGMYSGVEWTDPPPAVREALRLASQVQAVQEHAGARPRRLDPHRHPRRHPPHPAGRVRVRAEVRLQIGDGVREAERAARDLGDDRGRGQAHRRGISATSRSGPRTSTRR